MNPTARIFRNVLSQFLKEQLKDIGSQPFMDLGKLLKGGTTEIAVTKWVETHYPH